VSYLYSTDEQRREMLQAIGAASTDELFQQIPAALRLQRPLALPPPLTELELEAELTRQARRNATGRINFLGGGAYDHFIPAVVDEIAARGEFYTAYTPYQPEASQGSLQAFFEYQSLICRLTGMDVSNASLYEGGTAVSEAAFMAMRVTGRHQRIVVLGSVHPEYRQVLATYTRNLAVEIVTLPTPDGTADLNRVREAIDDRTACLIWQSPNVYGCLEDSPELAALARERGALAVISFDPISLGLLARPGDAGVDIAVAEGQSLGTPLQYGGPYLGVLACRQEYVRKMPGRLVTLTTDRRGRPCYVLGLQTREQHIRREKATSNICTNQGLLALRAAVYLSLLGPQGLRETAELCCRKAHYAAERLTKIPGVELMFQRPFFKEFVLRCQNPSALAQRAREAGFDVGPELRRLEPQQPDGLLVAVTERRTREEIDRLADACHP
jgi:glycine dehydrogenase subunit 1